MSESNGTRKLDEVDYHKFVRLVQAVDLVAINAQKAVAEAMAKRDACYATLREKHDLPETLQSVKWNDETLEIEVT